MSDRKAANDHGHDLARSYLSQGGNPNDKQGRSRFFDDHVNSNVDRTMAYIAFTCEVLSVATTDDRPLPIAGEFDS